MIYWFINICICINENFATLLRSFNEISQPFRLIKLRNLWFSRFIIHFQEKTWFTDILYKLLYKLGYQYKKYGKNFPLIYKLFIFSFITRSKKLDFIFFLLKFSLLTPTNQFKRKMKVMEQYISIPCEFGECALKDAILGCRLGPRALVLDPRRSWCSSLFSLNKDTFIKRGFGVLNIVLFSRHLAL